VGTPEECNHRAAGRPRVELIGKLDWPEFVRTADRGPRRERALHHSRWTEATFAFAHGSRGLAQDADLRARGKLATGSTWIRRISG
jgi:hypothetical protein